MRKLILSIIALSFITFSLEAQTSGGPDAYGYTWKNSSDPNGPTYNWVEIDGLPSTVEVTTLGDDNVTGAIPLPAPFRYYWYYRTKMYIGSNGYLTFFASNVVSPLAQGMPVIPTADTKNDFIAGFLTDLTLADAGGAPVGRCYYNITPNNDSVIVTYDNVPFYSNNTAGFSGLNTFQIILLYADSSMLVQYKLQSGLVDPGLTPNFMSNGIENVSGAVGLQNLFNAYPVAGTAVKYYHPATSTLIVKDASTVFNDNVTNRAKFLSMNGPSYYLNTEVLNSGNVFLDSFPVKSEVRNSANALIVGNTTKVYALSIGQSKLVNQLLPFIPTIAGSYRFRTDTQLTGDIVTSNNRKDFEIEVVDTTQATINLAYEAALAPAANTDFVGSGAAVYMKPPFTPYVLNSVKEFVAAAAASGFAMMIFDEDVNGAPNNLLDSIYVAPGSFTSGTWITTNLTSPLQINNGGFFVAFVATANDTAILGTVADTHISRQNYEIIGGTAPANFASYRDGETEEFMIRANISKVVSVKELEKGEIFGNIYPNPSSTDKVYMSYDLTTAKSAEFTVKMYNVNGQMVQGTMVSTPKGTLELDVKTLGAGLYLCKIANGTTEVERKFTIIR